MELGNLILKYSKPGPRYTSYPTAPQWTDTHGASSYRSQLSQGSSEEPCALYVHIPFCESLCYYCGCNIKITKDHKASSPYVETLIREIHALAKTLEHTRKLSQISWGGGTPTFLSIPEIQELYTAIEQSFEIEKNAEISIEIDPRVTSVAQLEVLRSLGFNRISLGVQDFDLEVQKAVNRIQSPESTASLLNTCRKLGFTGINFDLIYGLPYQTLQRFSTTVAQVIEMEPDRIALYNYAHLPSLRPHQKIFESLPRPSVEERVAIFELAYHELVKNAYVPIGMDHFAKANDELALALKDGRLYRNFMGYTVKRGAQLFGVGASAISELEEGFFQNIRESKTYQDIIPDTGFATFRGCFLSDEDKRRKWTIQQLMCKFRLSFQEYENIFGEPFEEHFSKEIPQLASFFDEEILEHGNGSIRVTEMGRLFVRNVAMVFDEYLGRGTATYSKTL